MNVSKLSTVCHDARTERIGLNFKTANSPIAKMYGSLASHCTYRSAQMYVGHGVMMCEIKMWDASRVI